MRKMMGERFVLAVGLPHNGLISEYDVAQMPAAFGEGDATLTLGARQGVGDLDGIYTSGARKS